MNKKQPNMRWRKKDVEEYEKLVKAFNSSIDKKLKTIEKKKKQTNNKIIAAKNDEENKDPTRKLETLRRKLMREEKRYEAANLPKISARDEIKTRKEYKAEVEKMQAWLQGERNFIVTDKTEKELDEVIRKFNNKIDNTRRKIRKKYTGAEATKRQGEYAALPQRLNKNKLLKTVQTEKGLKELIKDYKGFLEHGAEELIDLPGTGYIDENNIEHNIKMTKWEKKWADKQIAKINKYRAEEKKLWEEADLRFNGNLAGYNRAEVGMDKGDYNIREMTLYSPSHTNKDIKHKIDLIMREMQPDYWNKRTELSRESYLKALQENVMGHPIGQKIYEYVKTLPLNDFKRVLTSEDNLWLKVYKIGKTTHGSDAEKAALKEVWSQWFTHYEEGQKISVDMENEFDYFIKNNEWRI